MKKKNLRRAGEFLASAQLTMNGHNVLTSRLKTKDFDLVCYKDNVFNKIKFRVTGMDEQLIDWYSDESVKKWMVNGNSLKSVSNDTTLVFVHLKTNECYVIPKSDLIQITEEANEIYLEKGRKTTDESKSEMRFVLLNKAQQNKYRDAFHSM